MAARRRERADVDLHYRMVAEIYEEALAEPYVATPPEAVMVTFQVPRATADNWICRARKRGHLPPSRRITRRLENAGPVMSDPGEDWCGACLCGDHGQCLRTFDSMGTQPPRPCLCPHEIDGQGVSDADG